MVTICSLTKNNESKLEPNFGESQYQIRIVTMWIQKKIYNNVYICNIYTLYKIYDNVSRGCFYPYAKHSYIQLGTKSETNQYTIWRKTREISADVASEFYKHNDFFAQHYLRK